VGYNEREGHCVCVCVCVCLCEKERQRETVACKTGRLGVVRLCGILHSSNEKKKQQKTNGLGSETSGIEHNLSHIDYY